MTWKKFYIELPCIVKSFINGHFQTLSEYEIANLDFVLQESDGDDLPVHFYSRLFDLHFTVALDTDEEIGYFVTLFSTEMPTNYCGNEEVIFVSQNEFQIA